MPKPYSDPYAILGLPRNASAADIKQAYFALVRRHPPEREPEMFKRIRAAYEQLRDPPQRAETDMLLLNSWPTSTRPNPPATLDLSLHTEDLLLAARAISDLVRNDWSDEHKKVEL
ncbi:MAG: J domain-containing protein [Chloroflexaceae bacterium]|jgi:curved DNA-binding protein CbpA|nr:J domain-containing protein [Chloroflexaceae bacterium]